MPFFKYEEMVGEGGIEKSILNKNYIGATRRRGFKAPEEVDRGVANGQQERVEREAGRLRNGRDLVQGPHGLDVVRNLDVLQAADHRGVDEVDALAAAGARETAVEQESRGVRYTNGR